MAAGIIRFADFELERAAYQLRHQGRTVQIERLPLDLLFLLAERSGQLVTRDEIYQRIGVNPKTGQSKGDRVDRVAGLIGG